MPDHGKLAPWRFIVIAEAARERVGETIAATFAADNPEASPERLAQERARLMHAPMVVAVVSRVGPHVKIPEWSSCSPWGGHDEPGHRRNASGFATAWLTEWYAYDRRVLDALGSRRPRTRGVRPYRPGARSAVRPAAPSLSEIVTYL